MWNKNAQFVLAKTPTQWPRWISFLHILRGFLAGLAALVAVGCATTQTPPMPINDDVARKQAEQAAQRIRVEAAALRAEMASARIAAAKKDAEVQELRRHLAELTQLETQRQQKADDKTAEVMMLRTERDRLLKEKSDLTAQLANPNRQVAMAAETAASQNKMKAMDQALSLLAHELSQVKQQIAKTQPKGKGKSKDGGIVPSSATDESVPTIQPAVMEQAPDRPASHSSTRHIVQAGESLFSIAREYGITLDELKKANGLKGETVKAGRRLVVPLTQ